MGLSYSHTKSTIAFSYPIATLFFGVNDGFRLAFLYVNLISFWRFVIVRLQTLTPISSHLFLICFGVRILFSRHIAFRFVSWRFDVFLGLPVCLPWTTLPGLFVLGPDFRHDWLWRTTIFCKIAQFTFFMKGSHPLLCFKWHILCQSHVSCQFAWRNMSPRCDHSGLTAD